MRIQKYFSMFILINYLNINNKSANNNMKDNLQSKIDHQFQNTRKAQRLKLFSEKRNLIQNYHQLFTLLYHNINIENHSKINQLIQNRIIFQNQLNQQTKKFILSTYNTTLNQNLKLSLLKLICLFKIQYQKWLDEAFQFWQQQQLIIEITYFLTNNIVNLHKPNHINLIVNKFQVGDLKNRNEYLQIMQHIINKLTLSQKKIVIETCSTTLNTQNIILNLRTLKLLQMIKLECQQQYKQIILMKNFYCIPQLILNESNNEKIGLSLILNLFEQNYEIVFLLIRKFEITKILKYFLASQNIIVKQMVIDALYKISKVYHNLKEIEFIFQQLLQIFYISNFHKLQSKILSSANNLIVQYIITEKQSIIMIILQGIYIKNTNILEDILQALYIILEAYPNMKKHLIKYGLTQKLMDLQDYPNNRIYDIVRALQDICQQE